MMVHSTDPSVSGSMLVFPRAVASAIESARRAPTPVMLTGESGTGRTTLAYALHGRKAGAEAVLADCGEIGSERVELELFGNKASTPPYGSGARRVDHITASSLLARAVSGTLILRQIEEMPERTQLRLLRILRDREAVVEGRGLRPVEFRPMTIVGPLPDLLLTEGRIRSDLFRKLSSTIIRIPPLRERRQEIPQLSEQLLLAHCRGQSVEHKHLTQPALALLAALPWRGNLVELKCQISALAATAPQLDISLEHVLTQLQLDAIDQGHPTIGLRETLRSARARFEREYISAVLSVHNGRIPDAAKALGIQRTNLYRKLRTLHLVRPVHSQVYSPSSMSTSGARPSR